jgi:hypothetical protein
MVVRMLVRLLPVLLATAGLGAGEAEAEPLALPRQVQIRNTTDAPWALTFQSTATPLQVEIAGQGMVGTVAVEPGLGAALRPIRLGPGDSARLLPADRAVAPQADFTLTRAAGAYGQAFRWGFPRDWAVAPVHWQYHGPEPRPVSFRLHYPTASITLVPEGDGIR